MSSSRTTYGQPETRRRILEATWRLLVGLVQYMDEVLDSGDRIAAILEAPSGVEALERMVRALSTFTERIDSVARVLEAAQYEDEALAAAWRNRSPAFVSFRSVKSTNSSTRPCSRAGVRQ